MLSDTDGMDQPKKSHPPSRTCEGLFLLLFNLRPSILQSDGAIENRFSRFRIKVHAEISQSFELIPGSDGGIRQGWFKLCVFYQLQRIWVEVGGEFLAVFCFVGVFFGEEPVINPHFGIYGVGG